MGYDVTFHPVAIADLERLVFDVVRTPALAAARAKEASATRADDVAAIYGHFASWLTPDEDGELADVNATFAFAAAAVAGFRHPYWYARGCAMSFLPKLPVRLVPLNTLAKGLFRKLPGAKAARIGSNYTASGVVMPEEIAALATWLAAPANAKVLARVFDDEGLDALRRAVAYAAEHGLGLIEATDLVVPIADESATDLDNLRAHFMHRLEPDAPPKTKARTKAKTKATAKRAPPAVTTAPEQLLAAVEDELATLTNRRQLPSALLNVARAAYLAGVTREDVLARLEQVAPLRGAQPYALDFAEPCVELETLAGAALAGAGDALVGTLRKRKLVVEVPSTRELVGPLAAFFTRRLVAPTRIPRGPRFGPAIAVVAAIAKKDRVAAKTAIEKFVRTSWWPHCDPALYGQDLRAPVGKLSLFAAYAIRRAGLAAATWPDEVAAAIPSGLI